MGIFDAFKKEVKKNKEVIAKDSEIKEKSCDHMREKTVENERQNHNKKGYILTNEKCNELLQRILHDSDHGISMMKESSLSENIFVLGYIENSIMPDLKKKGNEKDYMWFYSTMAVFRKIFLGKIFGKDTLWKVMSKTTGLPFMDKGCEHILVYDTYKEVIKENLKKIYYDVEIVEIKKEEFKNEIEDLFRKGYKGMCFSDGITRPYYFSKESITEKYEQKFVKHLINPETQYCMSAFFQEIRRNVNYEGADKIRCNLENAMIKSIINTTFIVPMKKSNAEQAELPVYISSKNENTKTLNPGVYVFTDKVEAMALEKINFNLKDGWDLYTYNFNDLMKLLEKAHVNEICINCGTINFKVNKESLKVLKEQSEQLKRENEKKQEKWEETELPQMLKDKKVPIIKDNKGLMLFARKNDSILMSKFIFDILVKRNMKDEIMNMFFEDEDVENLTLYDFDFRRITLKLKKTEAGKGLFIIPMRYDDEKEIDVAKNDKIYYTHEAAIIHNADVSGEKQEVHAKDKIMNFYTIENKDTHKMYIPMFSNEKEAEKIYAKDKFHYCLASYNDIIKQAVNYDGVVINPASMSFILEKQLLENIFDIVNN